jgi:hypothetical protein
MPFSIFIIKAILILREVFNGFGTINPIVRPNPNF